MLCYTALVLNLGNIIRKKTFGLFDAIKDLVQLLLDNLTCKKRRQSILYRNWYHILIILRNGHLLCRGQKFHSSTRYYEWNLERTSNSSKNTRPVGRVYMTSALGKITWGSCIIYCSLMFFIAYAFKGHVHAFAGRVKVVSHSSCRSSAIFKYFCPLLCNYLLKTVLFKWNSLTVLFKHFFFYYFMHWFCLIWFFMSQSTNFQLCWERSSWVEPVLSKDLCLAQGHRAVTLVMLEPTTPQSWVEHSTTEPLHSLYILASGVITYFVYQLET